MASPQGPADKCDGGASSAGDATGRGLAELVEIGKRCDRCGARVNSAGEIQIPRKKPSTVVKSWGVEPMCSAPPVSCDLFQAVAFRADTEAQKDLEGVVEFCLKQIPQLQVRHLEKVLVLELPQDTLAVLRSSDDKKTAGCVLLEHLMERREDRAIPEWWCSGFFILNDGSERGIVGKDLAKFGVSWWKWPEVEATAKGIGEVYDREVGPGTSVRLVRKMYEPAPEFASIPAWDVERVPFDVHAALFPRGMPVRHFRLTGPARIRAGRRKPVGKEGGAAAADAAADAAPAAAVTGGGSA